MSKGYQLKENADVMALVEKLSFLPYEVEDNIALIKLIVLDLECDLVKELLYNYFQNPEWIEKVYKKNKRLVKNTTGVRYDKYNNIITSEDFENHIRTWFLQIDLESKIVVLGYNSGVASFIVNVKEALDVFIKEEIDKLKEYDLIKEFDYENEEENQG